jgi:hypothetical protein
MKGDREHVVPLSTRALAILEQMNPARQIAPARGKTGLLFARQSKWH